MNSSIVPSLALVFLGLAVLACSAGGPDTPRAEAPETSQQRPVAVNEPQDDAPDTAPAETKSALATFGAGCFWCVEAVLEQLDGVADVRSGYMGGAVKDPTYQQICTGTTGHAEVVQVEYDPSKVSYDTLLDWFWKLHDPTTLNRQGPDTGTQYRSAVFYHSPEQREAAERSKTKAQGSFGDPIVTEITEASTIYEAEGYHQDYYRLNKEARYCQVMITPKLKKLGLEE